VKQDCDDRKARKSLLTRRELLRRGAQLGVGVTALSSFGRIPYLNAAPARGAEVIVRTGGGPYMEACRKAIWEPFTQQTGIRVIPYLASPAKVLAVAESRNVELDVHETSAANAMILQQRGALVKLDRSKFVQTNPADLTHFNDYWLPDVAYATILAYNTGAFPQKHPTNWVEFWDVKGFPGSRILEDLPAQYVNLEQALLADRVPVDRLYPIDLDRALAKLREIRPHVLKWYDTGALAATMLAERQAVLGIVWNTVVQPLIDDGAPLAIEWSQAQRHYGNFCILSGSPNTENAYRYMDYALAPKPQALLAAYGSTSPTNRKALSLLDPKTVNKMATTPDRVRTSFSTNVEWWAKNREEVLRRWLRFQVGG
jgi:putative spermidine/putrescine transport system substrate-binding protein